MSLRNVSDTWRLVGRGVRARSWHRRRCGLRWWGGADDIGDREVVIDEASVASIGAVRLTSVARTITDLARLDPGDDRSARESGSERRIVATIGEPLLAAGAVRD